MPAHALTCSPRAARGPCAPPARLLARPPGTNKAGLSAVLSMLHEYLRPGANQAAVYGQLEAARHYPDFNNYLAFVLARGGAQGQASAECRQAAGLLLKNNCRGSWRALVAPVRAYVQGCVVQVLGAPPGSVGATVRSTAGSVASAIAWAAAMEARQGGEGHGFAFWPELPATLLGALDAADLEVQLGALDCVKKICEDSPAAWACDLGGGRGMPLQALVPKLLRALGQSDSPPAQRHALAALNELITDSHPLVQAHHDEYLRGAVALRGSPDGRVRALVSVGVCQLMTLAPLVLQPHMSDVIEFMLAASQDGDNTVALESSEFWATFCEAEIDESLLWMYAPRLVPVLLRNMVYADDDDELLAAEAEEAGLGKTGDEASELKPFHAQGRSKGGFASLDGAAGGGQAGAQMQMPGWGGNDEGEDAYAALGDDDDDDLGDDDGLGEWTLRKCSASALDVLSNTFCDQLLPLLMPVLEALMNHPDWKAQEACILTLGAISEGCGRAIEQHLPQVLPYIASKLEHPKILVRTNAAWALSRYSTWLTGGRQGGGFDSGGGTDAAQREPPTPVPEGLLDAVVRAMLGRMLDSAGRVQEATCSSLASLCEALSAEALLRYAPALAEMVAKAVLGPGGVGGYSRKSLRSLYDLIGAMCGKCGAAMPQEVATTLLMPLVAKLEGMADADEELLPLLECLGSVASSLRDRCRPAAHPTFSRAAGIVRQHAALRERGGDAAYQTQDFAVAALDVISGLVEGLGASAEPLVKAACPPELLVAVCADPAGELRQSAFALLGDVSKACVPHVARGAARLLQLCVANMGVQMVSGLGTVTVCNNACWAAGELGMRMEHLPPDVREAVAVELTQVASAAATLLTATRAASKSHSNLRENAAITLGRMALVVPDAIAPHAAGFAVPWCQVLGMLRDDVEKSHGFAGLCATIRLNPQAFAAAVEQFVVAAASWQRASLDQTLWQTLRDTLVGLRQMMDARWPQLMAAVGKPCAQKLTALYQLEA